jgi:hypothetical protein
MRIRGSSHARSDAGVSRLRHKDRPRHSWEKEAGRIDKANASFTSLDGGGKSNVEAGTKGKRPEHKDLFSREVGNLKAGKTDRQK